MKALPHKIEETIESTDQQVQAIARSHVEERFFLYLGRNIGLPVCLEGALKMKEISYIPSDAYAAGEMKHGPIALLDETTPVVCRRDRQPGARQGPLQRRRGPRPRRRRDRDRAPRAPTRSPRPPTRRSTSRAPTGSCSRSSRSSRCSCSRTTSPACSASTSTSRATWPRPSPSSSGAGSLRRFRVGAISIRPMRTNLLRLSVLASSPRRRRLAACGCERRRREPPISGRSGLAGRRRTRRFYVEAVIRPDGDSGRGDLTRLARTLGGSPTTRRRSSIDAIDEVFSSRARTSTYADDVEPWLGDAAGVFFNGFDDQGGARPHGALRWSRSTDADAARGVHRQGPRIRAGKTEQQAATRARADRQRPTTPRSAIDGDFLLAAPTRRSRTRSTPQDGESASPRVDDSTDRLDAVPDDALVVALRRAAGSARRGDQELRRGARRSAQADRGSARSMGDGPIDAWGTVTDSSMGFGASSSPLAATRPTRPTSLTTLPGRLLAGLRRVRRRRRSRLDRAVQGGLRGRLLEQRPPGLAPDRSIQVPGRDRPRPRQDSRLARRRRRLRRGHGDARPRRRHGHHDRRPAAAEPTRVAKRASRRSGKSRAAPGAPAAPGRLLDPGPGARRRRRRSAVDGRQGRRRRRRRHVDEVLAPSETLGDSDTFQAAERRLGDDLTPSLFVNLRRSSTSSTAPGRAMRDIDYDATPVPGRPRLADRRQPVDGERSVGRVHARRQDSPTTATRRRRR